MQMMPLQNLHQPFLSWILNINIVIPQVKILARFKRSNWKTLLNSIQYLQPATWQNWPTRKGKVDWLDRPAKKDISNSSSVMLQSSFLYLSFVYFSYLNLEQRIYQDNLVLSTELMMYLVFLYDERLTLETSTLQTLYGDKFISST